MSAPASLFSTRERNPARAHPSEQNQNKAATKVSWLSEMGANQMGARPTGGGGNETQRRLRRPRRKQLSEPTPFEFKTRSCVAKMTRAQWMLILAVSAILLSHSVPSSPVKLASCYQFASHQHQSAPAQVINRMGVQRPAAHHIHHNQLPFDISQLPTLSSDTAHLLPADFSDLPGDSSDWARKVAPLQAPSPRTLSNSEAAAAASNLQQQQQAELMFAPATSTDEEAPPLGGPASHLQTDEAALMAAAAANQPQPLVPLIMPKLANLLSGQQPLAFKNLINQTLSQQQSNLGRAIEATRTFVRQQQALAAAASQPLGAGVGVVSGFPRTSLAQIPGTVSNRLYNFLFQPRGQQLTQPQVLLAPELIDETNSAAAAAAAATSSAGANQRKRDHQNATTLASSSSSSSELAMEPIQSASSDHLDSSLLAATTTTTTRNKQSPAPRSMVTLSAPYEQRPRIAASTSEQQQQQPLEGLKPNKSKPSKSVSLMSSASGQHAYTTSFARPPPPPPGNMTASWRQLAPMNESSFEELEASMNETIIGDPSEQPSQQQQQQQQQQFVVGSEESESGQSMQQDEHHQHQHHHHHHQQQNQDQANAEFQASLRAASSDEESASSQALGEQQSVAEQPQDLTGYIEHQPQQIGETANSISAADEEGQPGDDGRGETLYLTPGHHRVVPTNLAGGNLTMLVPMNESDLTPSSSPPMGVNLQSEDSSLAAQLPSQYDSTIRLPPDGHYDDYFKPSGGGSLTSISAGPTNVQFSGEQVTSGSLSMGQQVNEGTQAQGPQSHQQEFFTTYNMIDMQQQQQQQQPQNQSQQQPARPRQRDISPIGEFNKPLMTTGGLFQQPPTMLASNGTPIDYTIQYYMNQQQQPQSQPSPLVMRQAASQGPAFHHQQDQTIEFVTTNQTIAPTRQQAVAGNRPNHRFNSQQQQQQQQYQPQVDANRGLASRQVRNMSNKHQQQQQHITSSSLANSTTVEHPMHGGDGSFMSSQGQRNQTIVEEFQSMDASPVDGNGRAGADKSTIGSHHHFWNPSTTPSPQTVNQTEDSIQVIVANSNSFQDPTTNERIITYTSEGRNFTRPNGKSARNTFFNKDLNELPPGERNLEQAPPPPSPAGPVSNMSGKPHETMTFQVQPARLRSTRSPLVVEGDDQNNHRVVVVLNKQPPQAQQQQQYKLVATTPEPQVSTERSGVGDEEDDEGDGSSSSGEFDADEQAVGIVQPGQFAQFGERQHISQATPKPPRMHNQSQHKINGNSGDNNHQYGGRGGRAQNQQLKSASGKAGRENLVMTEQDQRASRPYRSRVVPHQSQNSGWANNHNNNNNHRDHHHHHNHHQQFKNSDHTMRQQQTIKRPQVTEARFQLKDLPLNHPTAMPSVSESTIKSIEELPAKVKQIRNNQVDKNELMNELLTALDRVKAAIYKLQPLTAKMNAMYRKSVTSNTRDHIMDNHKGTYSKRYPPGDYDDTYDRMHPSELIDRQRNSQQRSQRRRRNDGPKRNHRQSSSSLEDRFQADESKVTAVYMPAPRGFNGTAFGSSSSNSTAQFSKRDNSTASPESTTPARNDDFDDDDHEVDEPVPLEQQFMVASGVGKRFGSGAKMRGRLSFSTPDGEQQILYDDDDETGSALGGLTFDDFKAGKDLGEPQPLAAPANQTFSRRNGTQMESPPPSSSSSSYADDAGERDAQSPLFGYKITIYQPLERDDASDTNDTAAQREPSELLSYSLVSDPTSPELSFNTAAHSDPAYELASPADPTGGSSSSSSYGTIVDDDDLMATSESSLTPTTTTTTQGGAEGDAEDEMDGSESSSEKKKKKMGMHEEEKAKKKGHEEEGAAKKRHMKKEGGKKGEKYAKHQAKHKKGEEEHKKKKEFKKIKHSKGVMSKESHKLHRDKHIKAHDRGAAKEKALKERTQIEFFEREQIVDDEFEKGKKSTMKAGWASGHDAKKVDKVTHGGHHPGADSMSMGGSNHVKHVESPPPGMMMAAASEHQHGDSGHMEKGHGNSMETSSGKQSNKFEKKHMEARGKKFKGWREKGYKIITETEFIDRGSLHDSAYKKRDKGAAHHQKFKKHEAKSEGHHGSMHEHHKKSHKKEEKKSKMGEKKKEMMGKKEGEEGKKHKKASHKEMADKKAKKHKHMKEKSEHGGDHESDESAPTMASVGNNGAGMRIYAADQLYDADDAAMLGQPASYRSNATHRGQSLQIGSSTLKPTVLPIPSTTTRANQIASMLRFSPSDHHRESSNSNMNGQLMIEPRSLNSQQTRYQMQQQQPEAFGVPSDVTNISRRSSDGGLSSNMGNTTLVDITNRSKAVGRPQTSRNETQIDATIIPVEHRSVENPSSPLLRLLGGLTNRYNASTFKPDNFGPQNSKFPPNQPRQQTHDDRSGRSDNVNSDRPFDRLNRILLQLSQAKLSEPLNRPLNLQPDQFQRSSNSGPSTKHDPSSMKQFDPVNPTREPDGRLFPPRSSQAITFNIQQQPVHQMNQLHHFQNLPPMSQQPMYTQPPTPLLAPPVQPNRLADASNQIELMDQFNAFDFDPEQLSSAIPPAFVSPLLTNPQFQQLPFGGNFIHE